MARSEASPHGFQGDSARAPRRSQRSPNTWRARRLTAMLVVAWSGGIALSISPSHAQPEVASFRFVAEPGPRHPEAARCLDELVRALRPIATRPVRDEHARFFRVVSELEHCGLDEVTRDAALAMSRGLRDPSLGAPGSFARSRALRAIVAPLEPHLPRGCRADDTTPCRPTHAALAEMRASYSGISGLLPETAALVVHVVDTLAARGDEWTLPAQLLWILGDWDYVRVSPTPLVATALGWLTRGERPARGSFRRTR